MFNVLNNVDRVPSNVQFSQLAALLYVFEDNEAVIKMIIKGRSPTMRHVSKTHRVALDWSFDRINSDPKIQIKYIDTKNQLADMRTKGNLTRDEWNHLFCLFNISHFSSTVCSVAMAKRVQQDSGEEKSHSEVEANDEADCKGSLNSVIFRRQKARGRKAMKVRSPGVRKLRKMIERGNPLSTVTCAQHATQGGMMTKLGLLKSGKLIKR